jgi:hypothetical protein
MAPIPTSLRKTTYNPVASAGPFSVGFPIFDSAGADIAVTLAGVAKVVTTDWTITPGTPETGFFGDPTTWPSATITFVAPITGELIIKGKRAPRRVPQYAEGAGVTARDLNADSNIHTAVEQELRRDVDEVRLDLDALDAYVTGQFEDLAEQIQAGLDAAAIAVAAAEDIQELYLGAKAAFPVVDNLGNPLQTGVWFTLTTTIGLNEPGPYVWTGSGWTFLGTSPESLPRGGSILVTDGTAASGIIPAAGGYTPGYVNVWRNGVKQIVGTSPGVLPGDPNCEASDGLTIVWPAGVLVTNNRIEWEYRRAFDVADIEAADVEVTPAGGIPETTVQAALQGLDTRIATLSVSAEEGQFKLSVSAAAGALTVALKTIAGADPTVGAPLVFPFPDGAGGFVKRQITAAFSGSIASAATLGASNGVALSVWAVLFDDGGTIRMGFVNCRTATKVLKLRPHGLYDALTPAANSAGVVYAAAAVSAKPIVVLGVIDWDTGLTTAGTWTAPTRTTPWQAGQPLPGDVIDFETLTGGAGNSTSSTSLQDVTGATLTLTRKRPQNAVRFQADATVFVGLVAATNTLHTLSALRASTSLVVNRLTGIGTSGGAAAQANGTAAMRAFDFPGNTLAATYKLQQSTSSASTTAQTTNISMEVQEIWA